MADHEPPVASGITAAARRLDAAMSVVANACVGDWSAAAEELDAMPAEDLSTFHQDLGALVSMSLAIIRKRRGQ